MLTLDACHLSLSIAIASNIPGYESGVCFVMEGCEERLVKKLANYLETLSDTSFELMLQKFDYGSSNNRRVTKTSREKKNLNEFTLYCKELIALGVTANLHLILLSLFCLLKFLYSGCELTSTSDCDWLFNFVAVKRVAGAFRNWYLEVICRLTLVLYFIDLWSTFQLNRHLK